MSRRWILVLNNYTEEETVTLLTTPCVYLIVGKEVGASGTPHLQGYIVFQANKRLSGLKKVLSRAHWEVAKGTTEENYAYCTKDGHFSEVGVKPASRQQVATAQHERWLSVIQSAKDGTCDKEFPREYIQYNSTIMRLYAPAVESIDVYTGLWWHGPPGTGKSRKARLDYPGLYDKLLNKWWDGYVDEEVVLIDDIDKSHVHMGLFLKRYADHYPFRAEYKGGSKVIRPSVILITSNYTIEEIFGVDPQMVAALRRRFKVLHFH